MKAFASAKYIGGRDDRVRRQVGVWLLLVALLVVAMVALGGFTRLTNSGLSMVEWRPVTGWLPPLSQAAWEAEFAKYQQFPEFRLLNPHMTLAGFKSIFWFEYSHRLLGRLIGLVFVVPLMVFMFLGRLPRQMMPRLIGIFLLGAGQGALGWFMVKSGLVDRPDVSHYRLTAHLGLAIVIFVALLWMVFGLLLRDDGLDRKAISADAALLVALVFMQALSGGLVAGLDAGFAYNTWPLMGDGFVPDGLLDHAPWWKNLSENGIMVQFQHRMGAYAVFGFAVWLWVSARFGRTTEARRSAADLVLVMALVQTGLGILTLVLEVPAVLGVLHQVGALGLLAACLFFAWRSPARMR